ncbi:MAG: helix-turn-helix domain-containing protein [Candidatus Ventricola sp.]
MNRNKDGFPVWDAEMEQELYTTEEIAQNNLTAKVMCELIAARKEKGLTQKELERLSGVRQPAIARMEKGISSPTLDTLAKLLAPLGKTIEIVPIRNDG